MSEIENNTSIIGNNIGNCLKDFEILQVLGKGSFGFVAKVKSKKNLKIYAMKKNDLSMIDDDDIKKYYENEGIFMKKLNHPNICKLYTTFKENNVVYLIMEYMDSGDLFTFLDAYKRLGENISEEKLCNIFLQCLNSLKYIHSLGIIHRDIKPANFLYNSNGEVKLSDFNVSALLNIDNAMFFTKDEGKRGELLNNYTQIGSGKFQAPEINDEENYDDKVDIYSMGVTFCTVAFFKLEIPKSINNNCSQELINLIKSMMNNDPHTRPSSKVLYDTLNKYYIQKFVHNTGLISCINCLSIYDSFKQYFLKEGNKISPFNEISLQFKDVIRSFNNPNESHENRCSLLYKFKNLIINNYGIKKNEDACSEIEPISIISFLLNKLHGELNTIKFNFGKEENYMKDYIKNENKKEEAYINYLIFYNSNFKSIISDNFFGLIKTKRICNNCGDIKYSFNMQSFIPFNVSILSEYLKKNKLEQKNLDIYYCFDCLNKNYIILNKNSCVTCENCENYTEHNEFKQFYSLPKNLIIFFDRGENYKSSDFINFEEKLVLNHKYVEKFKKKDYIYDLLGVICQIKETNRGETHYKKFISFTKSQNGYIINNDKNKEYDLKTIKDKNNFTVIGLFYYCNYVKSYISQENIQKYLNIINNNMNNMNNMNNLNNVNNMNNVDNMNNIDNMNNNFNNMNNNNNVNMMRYMNNNNNNINEKNINYNYMNNMNNNMNNNINNNNMNYNNIMNFNNNINYNENNIPQFSQYNKNNIYVSYIKDESNNNEISQNNMNFFNNNNQNNMGNINNNNNGFNQNNMNNFNYNNSGFNQNNPNNNFNRFNQNIINNNDSYQNNSTNNENNNINSNQSYN